MDRRHRQIFVHGEKMRIFLFFLVATVVASCVPYANNTKISYPSTKPTYNISISTQSPCDQITDQTPQAKIVVVDGNTGVFLPPVSYKCLVVRQRIALTCKKNCLVALEKTNKIHNEAQQKIISFANQELEKKEKIIKRHETKQQILITAFAVSSAIAFTGFVLWIAELNFKK